MVRLLRICDEQAGVDAPAYETIHITTSFQPEPALFAPPASEIHPLNDIDTTIIAVCS